MLKLPSGRSINIDQVTWIGNEQGTVLVMFERDHRLDLDTRSDVEALHEWLQAHAKEIPSRVWGRIAADIEHVWGG